jgi:hypothetical protein
MSIVVLNSDVDNFIVTSIVLTTAILFLLKWGFDKLKSQKASTVFEYNEIKYQLNNYIFNFEDHHYNTKSFGITTKWIAVVVSIIIAVTPLYKLIETLEPKVLFQFYSCFPH